MTKEARAYSGVQTGSLINGVGKSGLVHAVNETRPPIYTIQKINSKWVKGSNVS